MSFMPRASVAPRKNAISGSIEPYMVSAPTQLYPASSRYLNITEGPVWRGAPPRVSLSLATERSQPARMSCGMSGSRCRYTPPSR